MLSPSTLCKETAMKRRNLIIGLVLSAGIALGAVARTALAHEEGGGGGGIRARFMRHMVTSSIDDDARLGMLLSEYLGQNDVQVPVARDGEEGLRSLMGGAFDLVLLDLMLPGIDGLEVLRRIRRSTPRQPVLMLTAKGDDVDK